MYNFARGIMNKERYLHFNDWLKQKFGERTLKICIDGNFNCPNRDGTCGFGGCIFCGERGSGENTKQISIKEQVLSHLNGYKGKRANKFIAYFQNFSNTYDCVENLKKKYDQSLIDKRIVALAIATRPDCINEDVARIIAEYKKSHYVYVELGLQTASDKIGELINRGYTTNQFVQAVKLLNAYGIDVVAHVMVGLLGETKEDVLNTIDFLNNQPIMGIKIHSTYVIKNTELEKLFLMGKYHPISLNYYVEMVGKIIANLRKDIVVCRISGDAPKSLLVAPEWNAHKKIIINQINNHLEINNITQGCNLD